MTKDMVLAIIRHSLTIFGTWVTTRGVLDQATIESLIGSIVIIIGVILSLVEKYRRPRPDPQVIAR